MKRFWPTALIILGIIIFFIGFIYDVLYAGIPYPDPTPALQASYDFHARIASIIRWSGTGIFVVGVIGGDHSQADEKRERLISISIQISDPDPEKPNV